MLTILFNQVWSGASAPYRVVVGPDSGGLMQEDSRARKKRIHRDDREVLQLIAVLVRKL